MSDLSTLAKRFKRAPRNETGTPFSFDELRALDRDLYNYNESR